MTWPAALTTFRAYLLLERSLSPNTLDAYLNDVRKFVRFLEIEQRDLPPLAVRPSDLEQFILWINQTGSGGQFAGPGIGGFAGFLQISTGGRFTGR